MLCQKPRSVYFEPSQLKQILRSNFRPVRLGSVLNYSASRGLPRRTRSSKSSDASNTPETQQYPLQKTVNTIHFQATDTCLFKYQRPAQMLWKTENNTHLPLHLDMRVKESEMPRVWAELWSYWSVSLNLLIFTVFGCGNLWKRWTHQMVDNPFIRWTKKM